MYIDTSCNVSVCMAIYGHVNTCIKVDYFGTVSDYVWFVTFLILNNCVHSVLNTTKLLMQFCLPATFSCELRWKRGRGRIQKWLVSKRRMAWRWNQVMDSPVLQYSSFPVVMTGQRNGFLKSLYSLWVSELEFSSTFIKNLRPSNIYTHGNIMYTPSNVFSLLLFNRSVKMGWGLRRSSVPTLYIVWELLFFCFLTTVVRTLVHSFTLALQACVLHDVEPWEQLTGV